MNIVKKRFTKALEVREERPVQGNASGTTSVGTGRKLPVTIEIEVDLEAIAHELIQKVSRSKTGKSRYMNGKVKASIVGERPVLLIKQPAAPPPPPDRAVSTRHIDLP